MAMERMKYTCGGGDGMSENYFSSHVTPPNNTLHRNSQKCLESISKESTKCLDSHVSTVRQIIVFPLRSLWIVKQLTVKVSWFKKMHSLYIPLVSLSESMTYFMTAARSLVSCKSVYIDLWAVHSDSPLTLADLERTPQPQNICDPKSSSLYVAVVIILHTPSRFFYRAGFYASFATPTFSNLDQKQSKIPPFRLRLQHGRQRLNHSMSCSRAHDGCNHRHTCHCPRRQLACWRSFIFTNSTIATPAAAWLRLWYPLSDRHSPLPLAQRLYFRLLFPNRSK